MLVLAWRVCGGADSPPANRATAGRGATRNSSAAVGAASVWWSPRSVLVCICACLRGNQSGLALCYRLLISYWCRAWSLLVYCIPVGEISQGVYLQILDVFSKYLQFLENASELASYFAILTRNSPENCLSIVLVNEIVHKLARL